eukprot:GHVP01037553.1.p1 GENE.GHVP01037553.1~~GHVP01037553.1.p1  ORF type:complete len:773 (+),score=187.18 GHVP01037553.1:165-2483(+)
MDENKDVRSKENDKSDFENYVDKTVEEIRYHDMSDTDRIKKWMEESDREEYTPSIDSFEGSYIIDIINTHENTSKDIGSQDLEEEVSLFIYKILGEKPKDGEIKEMLQKVESVLEESKISEEEKQEKINKCKEQCKKLEEALENQKHESKEYELNLELKKTMKDQIDELKRTSLLLEERLEEFITAQREGKDSFEAETAIFNTLKNEMQTRTRVTKNFSSLIGKMQTRRTEQEKEISAAWDRIKALEKETLNNTRISRDSEQELRTAKEKYASIVKTNKLQKNEIEAWKNNSKDLTEKNKQINQDLYKLREVITTLQGQLEQSQLNNDTLESHVEKQDIEIKTLQTKSDKAITEKGRLAKEVEKLEDKNRKLQNDNNDLSIWKEDALKKEKESHSNKIENDEKLREMEEKLSEAENELFDKRKEKDSIMITYIRQLKENERLHNELVSQKEKEEDNKSTQKELMNKITTYEKIIKHHEEERIQRISDISSIKEKNSELKEILSSQKTDIMNLQEDNRKHKSDNYHLNERCRLVEKEKKDQVNNLNIAVKEIDKLKRAMISLKKEKIFKKQEMGSNDSREQMLINRIAELNLKTEKLQLALEKTENAKGCLEKRLSDVSIGASRIPSTSNSTANNRKTYEANTVTHSVVKKPTDSVNVFDSKISIYEDTPMTDIIYTPTKEEYKNDLSDGKYNNPTQFSINPENKYNKSSRFSMNPENKYNTSGKFNETYRPETNTKVNKISEENRKMMEVMNQVKEDLRKASLLSPSSPCDD